MNVCSFCGGSRQQAIFVKEMIALPITSSQKAYGASLSVVNPSHSTKRLVKHLNFESSKAYINHVIRTCQLCLQKMGMKSHSMIQTARISGGSSGTLNSIVSAADLSFSGADDEEKAKLLLGMVQPKQAKGHKSGLRADKKKK